MNDTTLLPCPFLGAWMDYSPMVPMIPHSSIIDLCDISKESIKSDEAVYLHSNPWEVSIKSISAHIRRTLPIYEALKAA